MRRDVLGIGFDDITLEQAVTKACEILNGDNKSYIVTPNPEIVWECRKNSALTAAVSNAALVLADGIGIAIASGILGTPLSGGRVPGIDFASALLREISKTNLSVFLYGAKPGIAAEAAKNLMDKYPGLRIAGTADGYEPSDAQVIELVNEKVPDLVFVCLGAPKQELWMAKYVKHLNVKLCVGLGGSLDVFAGKVKRAPVFFQKLGLEWLYRLICDPRRIKRTLKLPLFLFTVLWRRIRGI